MSSLGAVSCLHLSQETNENIENRIFWFFSPAWMLHLTSFPPCYIIFVMIRSIVYRITSSEWCASRVSKQTKWKDVGRVENGWVQKRDPDFYYPSAPLLLFCMAEQNVGLHLPSAISNNQFCPSYWRISQTKHTHVRHNRHKHTHRRAQKWTLQICLQKRNTTCSTWSDTKHDQLHTCTFRISRFDFFCGYYCTTQTCYS